MTDELRRHASREQMKMLRRYGWLCETGTRNFWWLSAWGRVVLQPRTTQITPFFENAVFWDACVHPKDSFLVDGGFVGIFTGSHRKLGWTPGERRRQMLSLLLAVRQDDETVRHMAGLRRSKRPPLPYRVSLY